MGVALVHQMPCHALRKASGTCHPTVALVRRPTNHALRKSLRDVPPDPRWRSATGLRENRASVAIEPD
jgi:hypothetical protein